MRPCRNRSLSALFFGAMLGLSACAENGGVEAGNPELKSKTFLIQPQNSATFYTLKILEESAVFSQVNLDASETVATKPMFLDHSVKLAANFSDGTESEVRSTFDESGTLLDFDMFLDGAKVPVEIQVQEKPFPDIDPSQAFLHIASALCERVSSCNPIVHPEACETEVLAVSSLSSEFGDASSDTLGQSQERLDREDLVVNEQALIDCIAGIEILPCEVTQKFFHPGQTLNYSKIKNIVPKPVCSLWKND